MYAGIGALQAAPAGGPRENLLLRCLPPAELRRIAPALVRRELGPGERARVVLEDPAYLHFPGRGLVSIVRDGDGRPPLGVAQVGSEGVLGLGLMLRREADPRRTIEPHTPVRAWSLPVDVAVREFARAGRFRDALLRYGCTLVEQVIETAVCRSRHSIEAQVRRWLLLALDRLPGPEVAVTQEAIAHALGVRRASVNAALAALQTEGGIVRARGRIRLVDRGTLEAGACACVQTLRRDHDALLRDLVIAALQSG